MPSDKKKHRSVLVQMETPNLIPERDLGTIPVLQAEHLGIDFGGLTAVDDFNIAMGRTEAEAGADDSGAVRGDTCHIDVVDRWGNMIAATPSGRS